MTRIVKKSIRCALIVPLALGPLAGVANAQERRNQDIRNVQLVFDLVQADGFTDEDPGIADVVAELRMLFNFRGYRLLSTSVLNVGLARQTNSSASVTGSGSQRIVPGDYKNASGDQRGGECAPFHEGCPCQGDPHRQDLAGDR